MLETKDSKKHVRENALPTDKIEHDIARGRADVGDAPTAETLGTLARKVISSSRHTDSRRLARAVNKTNSRAISKALGSNDADDWIGKLS